MENSNQFFHGKSFSFSPTLGDISECQSIIFKHGGGITKSITKNTTVYLADPSDLSKKNSKLENAKKKCLPILSIDFITACDKAGALQDQTPFLLFEYDNINEEPIQGSRKSKRQINDEVKYEEEPEVKKAKPEVEKTKSKKGKEVEIEKIQPPLPKNVTLIKKGKAPNDHLFPLSNCHVYSDSQYTYDCLLNQTEIKNNNNKFYIIQVLKSDSGNDFYTWTRWGRVGANGASNSDHFNSAEDAINSFVQKFNNKTNNKWGAEFVKKDGKYFMMERAYGDDDMDVGPVGQADKVDIPVSKLAQPLQNLMSMIFDMEMMKSSMIEIGYDANKMPLGKLTKEHVAKGYAVLKEISQELDNKIVNTSELLRLSSLFYTIIPHVFGMKKPQVINSAPLLKTKLTMVEALGIYTILFYFPGDIEIATRLINSGSKNYTENPLDLEYGALNCDIKQIEQHSEVFKMIETYTLNTHGKTHSEYSLKPLEVFELARSGEDERFSKLPNRQLLWHGSRLTNFVGILSQGLRIAPPEAPVTGYMFGKGVYFADMVSKSANYCCVSKQRKEGLLILCEVALGEEHELVNADYHADQTCKNAKKQSTKGVGRSYPDPNQNIVLDDGLLVPLGKAVEDGKVDRSLQYNEYIVYDVSQIRMKYLVKMKFDF